jgi:4-amino-4-deoxy-L-arabinose transferase-like glycosyltransferase
VSNLRALSGGEQARPGLRWPVLSAGVVLGLFIFHAINNWLWVDTNLTLMGWDRSSHLAKTLIYNDMLGQVSLRTAFTALTWPWNRPPLPFLSVVPFYRVFGVSTDVALMSNCLYLAILLGSVYGIGRSLYGPKVGLLASFLVSFYPVLFSISRLSYVDYAMTAMVALAIYLLLKTDGFRNRGWSLLFGFAAGLGLLTKWPFIAFAGAPIAYVAWRSGALRRVLYVSWTGSEGSTRMRRILSSPWLHGVAALVLTGAWYIPNWDRLPGFTLGYSLPIISWFLLASTFYVLSRSPGQATNLLSALMVGATLASAWSLPNIGFSGRFVFVAYGGINIQGKGLSFLDPTFYARYLSMMLTEQLSPLLFGALLVATGVLLFTALKGGTWRAALTKAGDQAWMLGLWLLVPLGIFTLSQTWNSRFDIALLPAAALITARGLLAVKRARLRWTLLAVVVVCAVGQFFVLSYDALYSFTDRTHLELPLIGRLNLLGEGAYIMPPSTDRMDSGYWVAPRILGEIDAEGQGPHTLALLVNHTYLNADILRYLVLLNAQDIEVWDLGRDEVGPPAYVQMFAADNVVISTHDPYKLTGQAREAVQEIAEAPAAFSKVFAMTGEYRLPDGEVVSLYTKRLRGVEQQALEYYRHLADALRSGLTEESAVILDPPVEIASIAPFYAVSTPVYLLPASDSASTEQTLKEIVTEYERVYVIFRTEDGADPHHLVEGWLSDNTYRTQDQWFGDARLVLFASPGESEEGSARMPLEAVLGGQVALVDCELVGQTSSPGQILRIALSWELIGDVTTDYSVFVHLLDSEGGIVAQHDGQPVGGMRPTTSWTVGKNVGDKHGLLIPDDVLPGEYRLEAGMYVPDTGQRLTVAGSAAGSTGDAVSLGTVRIIAPEAASEGVE